MDEEFYKFLRLKWVADERKPLAFEIHAFRNDDLAFFYTKGWTEKQSFSAQLYHDQDESAPIEEVQHCYGAWLFDQTDEGPRQCLFTKNEPGRGRFKITCWTREMW